MTDHEPGMQQTKLNGRDHQEVHRGDAMLVIAKKRLPALALFVVRVSLREIPRDGGEANRDPELLEFRTDLSGTPAILVRESTNEGLNLWRDSRASGPRPRDGSPVEPITLAMPANDRVRLDDDEIACRKFKLRFQHRR